MIAVDTNILVYAHRVEMQWHEEAARAVASLASAPVAWAIPWPCIHEFLGVATNGRIFSPPTPREQACAQVEIWMESPSLALLGEEVGYWQHLRGLLTAGKIAGAAVHDARIAALCRHHGVSELWTADRDFSRFPGLTTRNPLIAGVR